MAEATLAARRPKRRFPGLACPFLQRLAGVEQPVRRGAIGKRDRAAAPRVAERAEIFPVVVLRVAFVDLEEKLVVRDDSEHDAAAVEPVPAEHALSADHTPWPQQVEDVVDGPAHGPAAKKSLPLSSITMKAGKSST